MNTTPTAPIWRTLGELELPVSASTDEPIQAWLAESLAPLNLPSGFTERVLRSAQESARRAFDPNAGEARAQIHVLVLVPSGTIPSGRTWGFFHIERIEASASGAERQHAIDFYLYGEGE